MKLKVLIFSTEKCHVDMNGPLLSFIPKNESAQQVTLRSPVSGHALGPDCSKNIHISAVKTILGEGRVWPQEDKRVKLSSWIAAIGQ